MNKEIGFIGLGRMGLNMVLLLKERGYSVTGYDTNTATIQQAAAHGIKTIGSEAELVQSLSGPRTIWLMVPSAFVDTVITTLVPFLEPGDTIIDGGNSFYKDSIRRHAFLAEVGLQFLDCGTSGGTSGARNGASLMIGGNKDTFESHEHLFKALATENGYARVGENGAGHFVKMIHNGIEYGMMGALAEGMTVLHEHEAIFGINIQEVFKPYEHESIIASKLVSWLRKAYEEGQIETTEGTVPVGETEFEMEHVTTLGDVKVLQAALSQRKATRETPSYLGSLLAAMRNQFGGHHVISKD